MATLIDAIPVCPICNLQCSYFHYDITGELVGCNNCVTTRDAFEVLDEAIENEEDLHGDMEFESRRELRFG